MGRGGEGVGRTVSGLRILDAFGIQNGAAVRRWPNLRASVAVFKFERG